jgi:hypothetical protein
VIATAGNGTLALRSAELAAVLARWRPVVAYSADWLPATMPGRPMVLLEVRTITARLPYRSHHGRPWTVIALQHSHRFSG